MVLSFHYCSPSPPFSSLPLAVKLPPNGFCLIEMAHLGTVDPNLIALWGPEGSRSNSDPPRQSPRAGHYCISGDIPSFYEKQHPLLHETSH